ncbi:uncharacterized protein LOC132751420 [Ruditapes philippinarum]|uniref:uncharacterized protein LOC132751420 n=1 Tax=Ruditapes philippinarum TaxID=129788 RepID=UPI00295B7679|nr:uncharacterized protein LOC132751420 [Ruditapes philippinarum]
MENVRIVLLFIVSFTIVVCAIYWFVGATAPSMELYNSVPEKENVNMKSGLKTTETKTPSIIIQYGMPRTATTLQFNILCAIVSLQHISEIGSVGCFYNNRSLTQLPKYSVIKTHQIQYYYDIVPPGTWVVTTLDKTRQRNLQREIKSIHSNITSPLSIEFSVVKALGASIVYKYQSLFSVSDENIEHVLNYIKLWEMLRICCGQQMSGKWRAFLVRKTYALSSRSPCLMYNISEIEKRFINTHIYKLFSDKPLVRSVLTKPSIRDGRLNGKYCEMCNRNISLRRIKHFKRCF